MVVVPTPAGQVGVAVCYDLRFPELFRRMSTQGADFFVVSAAFTVPTGEAHWDVLLRARAVENLCYLVASAQGASMTTAAAPMATASWSTAGARRWPSWPRVRDIAVGEIDLARQARVRARVSGP